MIRNLLIFGLFLTPAFAAEPDYLKLAGDVLDGKAAAFSPKDQATAVYGERKGTADSDYTVDFFKGDQALDPLLVFHESYDDGDDNPSSHANIDAAHAEAAPKLAERLKAGEYVALPEIPWTKGKTLKAIDLVFTWKGAEGTRPPSGGSPRRGEANQLMARRGKGKPVVLKTIEQRDGGYAKPKPTALYALAGQRMVVLAVDWPIEKGVDFMVPESEYIPVALPEGL